MIIDGVEVLYTMRNGKIVDPNIPTDGLVCYLDARGKTNNDIYKNVLLDLSGNGNHGTLQNFGFNEESGYVKDLSGEGTSGLKFDGVDDFIEKPITWTDNYSILLDVNPSLTTKNDIYLDTGKILFYHWASSGVFALRILKESDSYKYIDFTRSELTTKLIISISGSTGKVVIGNKTFALDDIKTGFVSGNISVAKKTTPFGSFGKIDFRKLGIWNRALTDAEIQQLVQGE